MRKTTILFIVLAAVGAAALGSLVAWQVAVRLGEAKGTTGGPQRGGPTPVETAPVERGRICDTREFPGTLFARSNFPVAAKVGGRLKRLLVDIGREVKLGDVVALIDDEEYKLKVDQAAAELEVSEANRAEAQSALDSALREFERAKALEEKKIASEAELDLAKTALEAREARLKVAKAQVLQRIAALDAAKVQQREAVIRALWEIPRLSEEESDEAWTERKKKEPPRLVGERFAEEGALVSANTQLLTIIDIRVVLAVIFVPERDLPHVRESLTVGVKADAFPGETFEGKVKRVSPVLQESSRKARVEVEIENPRGALKPGMFVRAQIEFAKHENAQLLPMDALTTFEERTGVFLVDEAEKKVSFVPVTVGFREGRRVEILEPALSGRVVTLGVHLLKDGAPVALSSADMERGRGGGGEGGGRGGGPGGGRGGKAPSGKGGAQ